jgi:hypothetical protein
MHPRLQVFTFLKKILEFFHTTIFLAEIYLKTEKSTQLSFDA